MLTCDFEPTICKSTEESPAKYAGKIKLKPLAYEDRLEIIEEQAIAQANAGDDDARKTLALVTFAKEFARDRLPGFFVSSNITRLEDGYVFDSLEKLKLDGPASGCIPEMSSAIISGGLSLGK